MKSIVKMNGFVYLVEDNSSDGRFQTFYNLGKDPEYWEGLENEDKPKEKKKKSKE